jgi:hypothetical protein
MMSADIDVETGVLIFKDPFQYQVLSFLRIGLAQISPSRTGHDIAEPSDH